MSDKSKAVPVPDNDEAIVWPEREVVELGVAIPRKEWVQMQAACAQAEARAAEAEKERDNLQAEKNASTPHRNRDYSTNPISDERLAMMCAETCWWKTDHDEIYRVVHELRDKRSETTRLREALETITIPTGVSTFSYDGGWSIVDRYREIANAALALTPPASQRNDMIIIRTLPILLSTTRRRDLHPDTPTWIVVTLAIGCLLAFTACLSSIVWGAGVVFHWWQI